jgi:hypothetical protein
MGWHSEGIAASGGLGSCQAHHVRCRSQEDQFGAESTMGETEGSSGCPETQAPHFSGRQEEDGVGFTCTLGED